MPLKLIPPGKRKSPFYIVRGRFLGLDIERSTQTSDPAHALRFKNELERNLLDGLVPGPGSRVTFHRACDLYLVAKSHLGKQDQKAVQRLKDAVTDKWVGEVVQADIDAAAIAIYPNAAPETRDRFVYCPAAAVVHYAAENRWCAWMRVKHPKTREPETRAATDAAINALIAATTGKRRLLLLWLAKHGNRITMALSAQCERIHLETMEYELYVSKSRIWRTFPLDEEVAELLKDDPDMQRGTGRLFPWSVRDSVYVWLKPLRKQLGVKFTPHMARHRVGKKLRRHGLRTIMDALGQTSPKSAFRYVSSDVEAVREASRDLGKLLGKR